MTDELSILIEEWKQNVALYIDQDKRGMERTKMFLSVHAGLLVFCRVMWKDNFDVWSMTAGLIAAPLGIFFTFISMRMCRRAHAFILLRKTQAMLIEKKIKEIMAPDSQWETSSGIVTTFTREHVSFRSSKEGLGIWQPLIDEVTKMDPYACRPLTLENEWWASIGHLRWLMLLHYALFGLWLILGFLMLMSSISAC